MVLSNIVFHVTRVGFLYFEFHEICMWMVGEKLTAEMPYCHCGVIQANRAMSSTVVCDYIKRAQHNTVTCRTGHAKALKHTVKPHRHRPFILLTYSPTVVCINGWNTNLKIDTKNVYVLIRMRFYNFMSKTCKMNRSRRIGSKNIKEINSSSSLSISLKYFLWEENQRSEVNECQTWKHAEYFSLSHQIFHTSLVAAIDWRCLSFFSRLHSPHQLEKSFWYFFSSLKTELQEDWGYKVSNLVNKNA